MAPLLGAVAQRRRSRRSSFVELLLIVAVALGLALAIQALLVKPFRIPSESMVPTLAVGERVLVDRITPYFSDPDRGDIVVFHPPLGSETGACGAPKEQGQACAQPTDEESEMNFIKRIVGLPGDELTVVDGIVHVDGRPLDEPYLRTDAPCAGLPTCNLTEPITVPPGHFFMMGDNRDQSADSREWGPVPEEWLIGEAFLTYWPPDRIGGLSP